MQVVWLQAVRLHLKCFIFFLFICLAVAFINFSERTGIYIVSDNGTERLGDGFIRIQGFNVGNFYCKGGVDWIWMKYWEVYCAVLYGSAQTIRVVSQIYRERTIEEVSANQERLTSANQIKLIG